MITPRRSRSLPALTGTPANLKLHVVTILRRDSALRNQMLIGFIPVFAGILFLRPLLSILGLVLMGPIWLRLQRLAYALRVGEVRAAKLISFDPPMVATYADLSEIGGDAHPVLMISPLPANARDAHAQRGDRVAMVGVGLRSNGRRFETLDVYPLEPLIPHVTDVDALVASVPEWQWVELDEALFELHPPYEPGIYVIPHPGPAKSGSRDRG